MTQQIGRAYRKNRRLSWLVVAAVIAIAAVAIPIASGGPDKYYTLGFPSSPTTPAAKASSPSAVTLCSGTSYTRVELTLSNVAKTQSLGSADVVFPGLVTVTPGYAAFTGGNAASTKTISSSGNTVSLRYLSLPKGKSVTFSVRLTAGTVSGTQPVLGPSGITAVVKQANDFNDTGGDANLFTLQTGASLPTLKVENCVTTIDGRVFLDKNLNGIYDFTAPVDSSDDVVLDGWSVSLYGPSGQVGAPDTTGSDGTYHFGNVPTGQDYTVCVDAPSGTWKQTKPTGNAACSSSHGTTAGIPITNLQSAQTSPAMDFASVATVVPSCESTFSGTTLSGGTAKYVAKLHSPGPGGATCKSGELVMYTYKSGSDLFATLHPTSGSGTFKVVEHIHWEGLDVGNTQNPVTLTYDDTAPYDGADKRTMLLCKKDPRPNAVDFPFDLPAGELTATFDATVLPSGETSCMIQSTDSAGTAENARTYDAWIYSNIDGSRMG